jgi:hypothetical protein
MPALGPTTAIPPAMPEAPQCTPGASGELLVAAMLTQAQIGDTQWYTTDAGINVAYHFIGSYSIPLDYASEAAAYDQAVEDLQAAYEAAVGSGIIVFLFVMTCGPLGELGNSITFQCPFGSWYDWENEACRPIQIPITVVPPIQPNNPPPSEPPPTQPPPPPTPPPTQPPCPPYTELPDCLPAAPTNDGNLDEVGQAGASVSYWLMVIAIYLLNIYESLPTGTGTGTQPSDDCCANVVAAIGGLGVALNNITAAIKALAPGSSGAPPPPQPINITVEPAPVVIEPGSSTPPPPPPSDPSVDEFIQQLASDGFMPADLAQLTTT